MIFLAGIYATGPRYSTANIGNEDRFLCNSDFTSQYIKFRLYNTNTGTFKAYTLSRQEQVFNNRGEICVTDNCYFDIINLWNKTKAYFEEYFKLAIVPGVRWVDFPLLSEATGQVIVGNTWLPLYIESNVIDNSNKVKCLNVLTGELKYLSQLTPSSVHPNNITRLSKLRVDNVLFYNLGNQSTRYALQVSGKERISVKIHILADKNIESVIPCYSPTNSKQYYRVESNDAGKRFIGIATKVVWAEDSSLREERQSEYSVLKVLPNDKVLAYDIQYRHTVTLPASSKELDGKDLRDGVMTLTGYFQYTGETNTSNRVDEGALSLFQAKMSYAKISDTGVLLSYENPGIYLDLTDVRELTSMSIPRVEDVPTCVEFSKKLTTFPDNNIFTGRYSRNSNIIIIASGIKLEILNKLLQAMRKGEAKVIDVLICVKEEDYTPLQLAGFMYLCNSNSTVGKTSLKYYTELVDYKDSYVPDTVDYNYCGNTMDLRVHGVLTAGVSATGYTSMSVYTKLYGEPIKYVRYFDVALKVAGLLVKSLANNPYKNKSVLMLERKKELVDVVSGSPNYIEPREFMLTPMDMFSSLLSGSGYAFDCAGIAYVVRKRTGFINYIRKIRQSHFLIKQILHDTMNSFSIDTKKVLYNFEQALDYTLLGYYEDVQKSINTQLESYIGTNHDTLDLELPEFESDETTEIIASKLLDFF